MRRILPRLVGAVGARPRPPSDQSLARIRYTPITRPFKEVAQLSARIARQQGFSATGEKGKAEGLLLDVAELWELFLLHCTRRAVPALRVEHGTTAGSDSFLLHAAADSHKRMGRLKPDILVRNGEQVVALLDAKYKRLLNYWPERPAGVDRGDLYQLASYLARHDPGGNAVGGLLYPHDAGEDKRATAERESPWRAASESTVVFERVATGEVEAISQIQDLLTPGFG